MFNQMGNTPQRRQQPIQSAGGPGGPPATPIGPAPSGQHPTNPAAGLSPHQQYAAWVAAGRHGASGKNVQQPPPGPGPAPGPGGGPPSGSAPAPGPAPPGTPASPAGPGGPGAGSGLAPNANPFVGSQTAPGGFNPFAPLPRGGPPQEPGGMPGTYAYNDPFNALLSSIPTMDENAKRQISGAMSSAGLTGNRFGSYAQNVAGQIGGETALQENQALLQAQQQQALAEQGQALTAAGTGVGAGSAMDQILTSHLMNPFAIGQYEQGRQDTFANTRYQDFNQNKLGWFPYLLQGAMQPGGQSYPGPVEYRSTGSQPGGLDWASALLPGLVGLGSATGLFSGLGNLFGGGGPAASGPSQSPGATTDPGVGG